MWAREVVGQGKNGEDNSLGTRRTFIYSLLPYEGYQASPFAIRLRFPRFPRLMMSLDITVDTDSRMVRYHPEGSRYCQGVTDNPA